ncbi:MAG TPA: lactonase family protein [Blastocatellia bacterium]|nr:lactonase family protein [Blastocatellia bacterium]
MAAKNFSRRDFCAAIGAGTIALPMALHSDILATPQNRDLLLYVGTYTNGNSEGVYVYRMNTSTGELKRVSVTGGVRNPSFIALAPNRRNFYAVSEVNNFNGQTTGGIAAFEVNQKSGELKLLNQQTSVGRGPCYISVSKNGKYALTANYGSGTLAVLPINPDGTLGAPSDSAQHGGTTGPNRTRQEGPHAHCLLLDAANKYVFAPDLGIDKVMIYKFDAKRGKLTPNTQPFYQTKPGAGPRHFTFHKNGKLAFVINELDSTISSLEYNAAQGTLKELNTISTLPQDFTGSNTCADIHVHPNGKFVYGSNRGHDSIAVFSLDEKTGKLSFVEAVSTQGKTPRNFAIDPSGTFLLAANQNTHNIVVFKIDPQTGKLTPTGQVAETPSPVCLKFTQAFS